MTIDCGERVDSVGGQSNDTGHVPRSGEGPPICQDILPGSGAKISNKVVTMLVEQKYSFIERNETFFNLTRIISMFSTVCKFLILCQWKVWSGVKVDGHHERDVVMVKMGPRRQIPATKCNNIYFTLNDWK